MSDFGDDLSCEQLHRVPPRFGVLAVIEAEQEQAAEPADLVIHALDLLDDGRGGADQPIVGRAVFRGDIAVGDRLVVLQELDDADILQQGQEIFPHHPAHLRAHGEAPSLLVGVGDKDLAYETPVGAARVPAAAPRPFLDRFPMARDIARVEVEAHRQKAVLAGEL